MGNQEILFSNWIGRSILKASKCKRGGKRHNKKWHEKSADSMKSLRIENLKSQKLLGTSKNQKDS